MRKKEKKERTLNNKGVFITGIIIVLVISGIAIALIFTGGLYAFKQVACYIGVNWSTFSLSNAFGPHAGGLSQSKILLTISTTNTNYTDCVSRCKNWNADCATMCAAIPADATHPVDPNCTANCGNCTTDCDNKYVNDKESNYTLWDAAIQYRGVSPGKVTVTAYETYSSGLKSPIWSFTTEDELSFDQTYDKGMLTPKAENCEADVSVTATSSASGVIPSNWPESGTKTMSFCSMAKPMQVNVTVHSVKIDPATKKIQVNTSLTGSDVGALCPNATIFAGMNTKDGAGRKNLCTWILDSRSTTWFNDSWTFRLKFNLTNDVGEDVENETAEAVLDFAPDVLTSCDEIVITNETSGELPTAVYYISDHSCGVYFNVTIPKDGSQTYYAYYGNSKSSLWHTKWAGYTKNYPLYNITDFVTNQNTATHANVTASNVSLALGAC